MWHGKTGSAIVRNTGPSAHASVQHFPLVHWLKSQLSRRDRIEDFSKEASFGFINLVHRDAEDLTHGQPRCRNCRVSTCGMRHMSLRQGVRLRQISPDRLARQAFMFNELDERTRRQIERPAARPFGGTVQAVATSEAFVLAGQLAFRCGSGLPRSVPFPDCLPRSGAWSTVEPLTPTAHAVGLIGSRSQSSVENAARPQIASALVGA